MQTEQIITRREVARMLRVHRNTVMRMEQRGMPALRAGRAVRYRASDVLNYVSRNPGRRRA